MAHKKKEEQQTQGAPYTIQDALKITEEIFNLSKEKDYHLGAFVHGLIFAVEYTQFSYGIPQQQIATIRRDCRKHFQDMAQQPKK